MIHGTVGALVQCIVYLCICFKVEETAHFVFPTIKGAMNVCMELFMLSTSNKVKNQYSKVLQLLFLCQLLFTIYIDLLFTHDTH